MSTETSKHPDGATNPNRWDYDAFLSYATGADYKLAVKLEEFLEGFHEEHGISQHHLRRLKICVDGSDFSLPRKTRKQSSQKADTLEPIKAIIRPYLARSASLVVIWPGRLHASPFMDWELEEFLEQNRLNGWDRPVRIVVTRGDDPVAEPANFFSARQLAGGLHEEIFYDFRGINPDAVSWKKVRDFDRERMRLATDLANPLDSEGRPLAVDDLIPGWRRKQQNMLRRRRNTAIGAAIIFTAFVVIAGAFALYAISKRNEVWSQKLADKAELLRNEGPEGSIPAITLAVESLSRRSTFESDLTLRRSLSGWWLAWETNLPAPVSALAFQPDGSSLSVLDQTSILNLASNTNSVFSRLYTFNAATGKANWQIPCSRTTSSVKYTPGGKQLVSSPFMGGLPTIWDAKTGSILHWPSIPRENLPVIFSSDGTRAIGCDNDGRTELWDMINSKVVTNWGRFYFPREIQFSADSHFIGICDDNLLSLRKSEDGAEIQHRRADAKISAIAFGNQASLIAAATRSGQIDVWDYKGNINYTLQGGLSNCISCVFAPNDKSIAAGGQDGAVEIWYLMSNPSSKKLPPIPNGYGSTWSADILQFSKNSQWFCRSGLFGGREVRNAGDANEATFLRKEISPLPLTFYGDGDYAIYEEADYSVAISRIDTGTSVARFKPAMGCSAYAVSANEDMLATGGGDGSLRVWRKAAGRAINLWTNTSAVTAMDWAAQGGELLSGNFDGALMLRDIRSSTNTESAKLSGLISTCKLSPDGEFAAAVSQESLVTLFDCPSMTSKWTFASSNKISGLVFGPDSSSVIISASDGSVRVLHSSDGSAESCPIKGTVLSCCGSADGHYLAAGIWNQGIHVWRLPEWETVEIISNSAPADRLAVSEDGKWLAAVDFNAGNCWVSNIRGDHAQRFGPFSLGEKLEAFALSPDGEFLALGGLSRTVRVWRVKTEQPIAQLDLESWCLSLAFDPLGSGRLACAWDDIIEFDPINRSDLIALAKLRLPRRLSSTEWKNLAEDVPFPDWLRSP